MAGADGLNELFGPEISLESLNWPEGLWQGQIEALRENPRLRDKRLRDVVLDVMYEESYAIVTGMSQFRDPRLTLTLNGYHQFPSLMKYVLRCEYDECLRFA